jgi:hypothetical protein
MASLENPAAMFADFPDRAQDGIAVVAVKPARRFAQQRIFGRVARFVQGNKRVIARESWSARRGLSSKSPFIY